MKTIKDNSTKSSGGCWKSFRRRLVKYARRKSLGRWVGILSFLMVERTPGSGAFILRSIRAVEDLSLLAEKRLGWEVRPLISSNQSEPSLAKLCETGRLPRGAALTDRAVHPRTEDKAA